MRVLDLARHGPRGLACLAAIALLSVGLPAPARAQAQPATFDAIDAYVRAEVEASALPWSRRLAGARHQRLALLPSVLVDVLLPLSVLVVLPLWVSTMGITPAFDLLGTWAVGMWTLPDVTVALLAISGGLLVVAGFKCWQLWSHRGAEARAPRGESPPVPGSAGVPRTAR